MVNAFQEGAAFALHVEVVSLLCEFSKEKSLKSPRSALMEATTITRKTHARAQNGKQSFREMKNEPSRRECVAGVSSFRDKCDAAGRRGTPSPHSARQI